MKEIPLTKNKVTLVDDEDFEWLSQWNWHTICKDGNFYAGRTIRIKDTNKKNVIYMHHVLVEMKSKSKQRVIHIDKDTLNNSKQNLEICTYSQMNYTQQKQKQQKSSQYKGVCWDKNRNKWCSQIQIEGKFKHLGRFEEEIDAALAYDKAANKCYKFALLNFPELISA